jgi:hypothetical protein
MPNIFNMGHLGLLTILGIQFLLSQLQLDCFIYGYLTLPNLNFSISTMTTLLQTFIKLEIKSLLNNKLTVLQHLTMLHDLNLSNWPNLKYQQLLLLLLKKNLTFLHLDVPNLKDLSNVEINQTTKTRDLNHPIHSLGVNPNLKIHDYLFFQEVLA